MLHGARSGSGQFAMILFLSAATASVKAQPQARSSEFFPKEYEPYGKPGTSTILGQAYLTMPTGEREYCSRQAVFMNPVTTYSFEWYRRNVIDRVELEPADPRGSAYHWVTRADNRGRFRFRDLPAGNYYLGCRVLPNEGFAHAEVRVRVPLSSTSRTVSR